MSKLPQLLPQMVRAEIAREQQTKTENPKLPVKDSCRAEYLEPEPEQQPKLLHLRELDRHHLRNRGGRAESRSTPRRRSSQSNRRGRDNKFQPVHRN